MVYAAVDQEGFARYRRLHRTEICMWVKRCKYLSNDGLLLLALQGVAILFIFLFGKFPDHCEYCYCDYCYYYGFYCEECYYLMLTNQY